MPRELKDRRKFCIDCKKQLGLNAFYNKAKRCKSCAIKKEKHPFYGKHHSIETREKISRSLMGRPMSNEMLNILKEANTGSHHSEETRQKIRERRFLRKQNIGYINSPETRQKIRESLLNKTGEQSRNWQGGRSFEPYPLGWNKTFKEQIRRRDNYKCQICGVPEVETGKKLDVHHKDYDKKNIDSKNLTSLCRKCHSKTQGNREFWKEFFIQKKQEVQI